MMKMAKWFQATKYLKVISDVLEYFSCLCCQEKVTAISSISGECTKCKTRVRMSKLKKSVSVKFIDCSTTQRLIAFNDQVTEITSGLDTCIDIEDKFLSAPTIVDRNLRNATLFL